MCKREMDRKGTKGEKKHNSRLHVLIVQRGWACVGTSEGVCEKESWRGRVVGEEQHDGNPTHGCVCEVIHLTNYEIITWSHQHSQQ